MADYPDWVLKHKKPGTYINVVKGKYYLYVAHSERIKGTDKVRRVSDGYLGRITEEDGLIPPKDKVNEPPVVLEYGMSATVLTICEKIHKGLRRSFTKAGDLVMAASILSYLYGTYDSLLFKQSYLSQRFPDLDFDAVVTKPQEFGIERGQLMIRDAMKSHFGEDLDSAMLLFPLVYMVSINGRIYRSAEPEATRELRLKYNLKWEQQP